MSPYGNLNISVLYNTMCVSVLQNYHAMFFLSSQIFCFSSFLFIDKLRRNNCHFLQFEIVYKKM
jgi:hypothetical protein